MCIGVNVLAGKASILIFAKGTKQRYKMTKYWATNSVYTKFLLIRNQKYGISIYYFPIIFSDILIQILRHNLIGELRRTDTVMRFCC